MHKIIIIVAVDKNWAIGKNNDLIYSIPNKPRKETLRQLIICCLRVSIFRGEELLCGSSVNV